MIIPGVVLDLELPESPAMPERSVEGFDGQFLALMVPTILTMQDGAPMPKVKVQIDDVPVRVAPEQCPSIPMANTAPRLPSTEIAFAARLNPSGKATEFEIENHPAETVHPQLPTVPLGMTPARAEAPVHPPLGSELPRSETPVQRIESLMEAAKALAPRQIGVRVESPVAHPVDLYLEQRGRDLHLSVHTADRFLAGEMRGSLGELSAKLADQGFRTETWSPAVVTPVHAAAETVSAQEQFSQPEGRGAPQGDPQQHRERRDRRRPQWLIEFEKRLFAPGAQPGRLI